MIFVDHVVILIIDHGDVARDIATVGRFEQGIETGGVLLHPMMHIHLRSAHLLWLGMGEVHANTHVAAVLLVRRFVRLHEAMVVLLVLVLVHLLLRLTHCGVMSDRPHLERR